MDLLAILKEESESELVAYTEFMLTYSTTDCSRLYCFFEGDEDKRYYGSRIEFKTEKKYKNYTCGGKDKVKKISQIIESKVEYENALVLFFIDKDYSNDVVNNNIYVTPCYSIENFYTTLDTLKTILINEFNLSESSQDYETAIRLFCDLQEKYHRSVLLFNAWLACQNDIREREMIKTRLNIDSAVNGYFYDIVKNNLVDIYDLSDLMSQDIIENNLYPNARKISADVLNIKIREFEFGARECIFRGKFEIKFFVSFLKALKNELCMPNSSVFINKCKCTLMLNTSNVISALTQYAITDDQLYLYLHKYKNVA